MDKDDRRSERKNIGQPPERYGEWESGDSSAENETTLGQEKVPLPVTSTPKKKSIVKAGFYPTRKSSPSSIASSSATQIGIRKKEAEIKAAQELASLEEAEDELEAQRRSAKRKRELIQQNLELDMLKIEADDDQHLSDFNNSSDGEPGSEIDELESRLKKLKGSREEKTPPRSISPIPGASVSNSVDQLVQVFTQAMRKLATMPSTATSSETVKTADMNKLLTRSVMGKDLPTFDGDPEEWQGFVAEFERSTDACGFTNVENLSRLRKSLKGRAKDTVKCLMVAPESVGQVMATLKRNFGQPELIIKNLIEKSRKLGSIREENPETFLDFSNSVNGLVSSIEALKQDNHMSNPILLDELAEKLPFNMKMDWGKLSMKSGTATLKEFAEWMTEQATVANKFRKLLSFSRSTREDEEKSRQLRKGRAKEAVFSTVPGTDKSDSVSKTSSGCLFCKKTGHALGVCKFFRQETTESKWIKAKELKVCFICLKPGHRTNNCPGSKKCERDGCQLMHHPWLHEDRTKKATKYTKKKVAEDDPDTVGNTNLSSNGVLKKLLRIIPVKLRGPQGIISTFAIMDEGSTVTMLKQEMADQLGLRGKNEALCVQWFDQQSWEDKNSLIVKFEVAGDYSGSHFFKIEDVRTVSDLNIPAQSVNVEEMMKRWPHLTNLKMNSFSNAKPTLLIGIDNAKLTAHRQIMEGPGKCPIATRTKLGWALGGQSSSNSQPGEFVFHVCNADNEDDLHKMVKDYFTTESFGVKMTDEKPRSRQDKLALEILEAESRKVGHRWETALLWKNNVTALPESKISAIHRLKCMERRMDRSEDFAKVYCEKIEEYEAKGFIRKLPATEAMAVSPRSWYLPHFGVTNPNKPGKIRLIFDAAAKSRGVSLNDSLMTGPDLLNPLQSVLLKFRQRRIAFTADIKDMFHRVLIKKEDQGSQRFLWRGMDRQKEPDTYEMQVMIFGATSSPASALYVKDRNARELQDKFSKEVLKEITDHFYMDDYLGNADSEEEAMDLIQDVIEVNRLGGFVICNWVCNKPKILSVVHEDLKSSGMKGFDQKAELPVERVLGLWWDPEQDEFMFKTNFHKVPLDILNCLKKPTKRQMASLVMSVYDPLGFLAPFKIKGMILLQGAWRTEVSWDEEIPDDLNKNWMAWVSELSSITCVRVPRNYSPYFSKSHDVQLHIFCDASEEAFTAVAYIRIQGEEEIQVAFANAKVRVAPLKKLTIPKLELQAAVMASRLGATLEKELDRKLTSVHYWTDSKTVLRWIRSESGRFKQFVAFRVGEILESTEVGEWRWIPTKLNVADDATRSSKSGDFSSQSRWLTGPEFLKLPSEYWPTEDRSEAGKDDEAELLNFVGCINQVKVQEPLPNVHNFSSYWKLVRSTAMVRKIAKFWINKMRKGKIEEDYWNLTVDDLKTAESLWWKKVQSDSFPGELRNLMNRMSVEKNSRLKSLSPFLDQDGVVRIKGRIDLAKVKWEIKRPVILDPKHKFVKLLILQYHKDGAHQGLERVVNDLRQRYWIINLREAVKQAAKSCQVCRNRKAVPVIPEMGSLPISRLQSGEVPFSGTGVDYFGPMEVTVGRRREKRWGVLFSCMVIRAVHLELSPSLDTDQMIQALMRFTNRRGRPKHIHSDNGTNFTGADAELRKSLQEFDQKKISDFLSTNGIQWHFIPPASPHMGGSWERLVQTVKKALASLLVEKAPKEYTLLTLFSEVENIVNSRPLTHVSADPLDEESLTPNHFLRLASLKGPSIPGIYDNKDEYLRKQWRHAQRLADHFWARWVREYLPTLTCRDKWHESSVPVKVGDVVILIDDQLPRNCWKKGLVTSVFPGKDGQVRVVEVKTHTGIYRRPVTRICPLGIRSEDKGATLSGGRMSPSGIGKSE